MNPPQLPIELIVTIAEFLAGSFAYGSLANLNLATRAVHEETLPVLFETVIWEGDRRWWIHEAGLVPNGWRYTRYLVVDDIRLKHIRRYFRLLAEDENNEDEKGGTRHIMRQLPRLVMIITKQVDRGDSKPTYDLHCTIYKPIMASTLLLVSTTRYHCSTSFLDAEVHTALHPSMQHPEQREEDVSRMQERIMRVSLEDDGKITPAAVEYAGWSGIHRSTLSGFDLAVSLVKEDDVMDAERTQTSIESIFGMIPERSGLQLHDIQLSGLDVDVLELVAEGLGHLSAHASFRIPVSPMPSRWVPIADNIELLKKHLLSIGDKYAEGWHQLKPIRPNVQFFYTYYEELDHYQDDDASVELFGSHEDCVVFGTLVTLDRSAERVGGEEDFRQGGRDGFELVIRRSSWSKWDLWEQGEGDNDWTVLFRKPYYMASTALSEDKETEYA